MTVSSTTSRVSYSGNGSTTAFAVSFYFLENTHLKVILRAADGTETVKTLTTDYTVAGAGNLAGGTVTMNVAPATGTTLVIFRNVPETQETDYQANDPFPAESHERALDKLTMIDQQQQLEINQALKVPATDSPSISTRIPSSIDRAGTVLAFDETGEPIAGPDIASVGTVATNIANVNTVATNIGSVNTVAGSIGNVNATGANIANVNTVAGISGDVTTVAGIAADVTTVAANVTDVTNFSDVYLGPKASDPTVRNDGSPLQDGDLYFNTSSHQMRAYGGTWSPVTSQAITITQNAFTGNGSTVAFTLSDSPVSKYNLIVEVGGVIQTTDTYTVSGTTLTFSTAPGNGVAIETRIIATNNNLNSAAASAVTFNQPQTGAVTRSVESKLREFVSVKDFGAVGDGVTDDAAAIQNAINATRNGKILFIPAGQYKCYGPLTIYKGSQITGESTFTPDYRSTTKNITKLVFTSTAISTIGIKIDQSELESGYVWGVSLKNLYLEGVNAVSSVGFDARSMANAVIENVGIRNFDIGVYLTLGMTNTWRNIASSQCTSAALYIASPLNNVTTTQYFDTCTFRESPWGIVIESKATGNSFGTIFNNCLIESTTTGGVNIHKSCGATFTNTYMENVDGTLFRIHKDGVAAAPNYGDVQIFGGDNTGLNSGLSTNAVDIGTCLQVTIVGANFKRCLNGIVCDSFFTPDNSVYVFAAEFVSVANRFVGEKNKVNGLYANNVSGSPRSALNYSSYYCAQRSGAGNDMFVATADSTNAGMEMGISTADNAGTLTSTHSSGGSSPMLLRVTAAGTEYEAARVHSNRYWKASATGSYSVPNYASGATMPSHQFLSDTDNSYSPTLAVTNTNAGASATTLITTKPDAVNGWHIICANHANGNERFKVAATGNVTNTNNSYGAISDIKLKQDIVDAGSQWGDIKALRIRKYHLKEAPSGPLQMGLIAQEAELISPGLVETTNDFETFEVEEIDDNGESITRIKTRETGEVTKSIKYSILYMKAVKALQEAMERIEALEAKVGK